MEKAAEQLQHEAEKAAKATKAIDGATRDALKDSIKRIESMAKEVRERIKDDRPAAVEVGQLLSQTAKVREKMKSLYLPYSEGPGWRAVESGAAVVARAYGLPKP